MEAQKVFVFSCGDSESSGQLGCGGIGTFVSGLAAAPGTSVPPPSRQRHCLSTFRSPLAHISQLYLILLWRCVIVENVYQSRADSRGALHEFR